MFYLHSIASLLEAGKPTTAALVEASEAPQHVVHGRASPLARGQVAARSPKSRLPCWSEAFVSSALDYPLAAQCQRQNVCRQTIGEPMYSSNRKLSTSPCCSV